MGEQVAFHFHTENIVDFHTRLTGPWDLQATQLTPGGFRSEHQGLTDGRSMVYAETFLGGVMIDCALAAGFVVFSLPNAAARSGKWWGRAFPENRIAYSVSGRGISVQLPVGYGNLIAIIPERDFRADFERETGATPDFLEGQGHYLTTRLGAFDALFHKWRELVGAPVATLGGPETLCRVLTRSLVDALAEVPDATRNVAGGFQYVRKMIEMCNDLDGQVDLDAVCDTLKVSRRSLEMHSRVHLGVTPHRYLRLLRMNQAFATLVRADPDEVLVKEVALNCHFHEIGRFAVEYRRLFGEPPSQTLRRPAFRAGPGRAVELDGQAGHAGFPG